MKLSSRIGLFILIALITFAILFFYYNPDVINQIWLYVIGLIGTIAKGIQLTTDYFKRQFGGAEETPTDPGKDQSIDLELHLLRYDHDKETTLGLLYIEDEFYCYTLEDAPRNEKITGRTRIPSGDYVLKYRKAESPLTDKYRERYSWFNYHIQLQDVPGFEYIYIHSGGDHTHTKGCILVSNSLNANETKSFLSNSRETFRRLYEYLKSYLSSDKKIVIHIRDEEWSNKIHNYV